ncbi:MAG: DUF3352 domain-containing protein [Planctomycetota bacterium]
MTDRRIHSQRGAISPRSGSTRVLSCLAMAVTLCLTNGSPTLQAEPIPVAAGLPASQMLPANTLAYIRIDNALELRRGLGDSSMGQMLAAPKLAPFASDFYRTANEAFQMVAAQFGLELDQLLTLPEGQVAVALIPGQTETEAAAEDSLRDDRELTDDEIRKRVQARRRQQNSFGVVIVVDAGGNASTMQRLVDDLTGLATLNQFVMEDESIDGVTLNRVRRPRRNGPLIEWFRSDSLFCIGLGYGTATDALKRLRGVAIDPDADPNQGDNETLAENADFGAVMSRSMGAEMEIPQVTFFLSPYQIVTRLVSRSGAGLFVAPIVEDLGLRKIRGLGGSLFRGGEDIEGISHLHVVVEPPRDGFFGVLRPTTGEQSPPPWVPSDVTSYMNVHWDIATAFDNLGKIVNSFAGEGRFDELLENRIQKRLDISARDDFINNLTGRYVTIQRYQRPAAWNAQARVHAFEVVDTEVAETMLKKMDDKLPSEEFRPERMGSITVNFARERMRNRPGMRKIERSFFLMDRWLMIADSRQVIEQMLRSRDGATDRLSNDLDYELVMAEITTKVEGGEPFLTSFTRDAESLRMLYEQAASPWTRDMLKSAGENNPFLKRFSDLMERSELPNFDQLEKYFGTTGIFGYDEAQSIHLGAITLRSHQ